LGVGDLNFGQCRKLCRVSESHWGTCVRAADVRS
jgi:hypothetical protein